jgi:hypothetical protein
MNVKTKFFVESIIYYQASGEVFLKVVTGGSEENKEFWKHTPAGDIRLHIDNAEALAVFRPGSEFYVTFEPAPGPPPADG